MVLNTRTAYTQRKHKSYNNAKAEAIRLARNNPNDEFIILQALARVIKSDIIIEEVEGAEIQF
jgi:hypothetical protein